MITVEHSLPSWSVLYSRTRLLGYEEPLADFLRAKEDLSFLQPGVEVVVGQFLKLPLAESGSRMSEAWRSCISSLRGTSIFSLTSLETLLHPRTPRSMRYIALRRTSSNLFRPLGQPMDYL